MTYLPSPIDTSSVELSAELVALTERLARNAHELWAAQRIAEGWKLGRTRDDSSRLHPCLVPYDALPEAEKQYDRIVVAGTLKAILYLGYRLAPPEA